MKTRWMAVAALALAAACGGGSGTAPADGPAPQARADAPGDGRAVGGGGPNVFALIGARQQLALTSAQVVELDSIGRMWSVRNDSLQRRIGGPGARTTDLGVLRPLLERMAENNASANQAVESLLTADQRRIACTLPNAQADDRRARMADVPGAGRPGMRGRMRPARGADTLPRMGMRRGWPWCTGAAPADSAAG